MSCTLSISNPKLVWNIWHIETTEHYIYLLYTLSEPLQTYRDWLIRMLKTNKGHLPAIGEIYYFTNFKADFIWQHHLYAMRVVDISHQCYISCYRTTEKLASSLCILSNVNKGIEIRHRQPRMTYKDHTYPRSSRNGCTDNPVFIYFIKLEEWSEWCIFVWCVLI